MLLNQLFWLGACAVIVSLAMSLLIILSEKWHGRLSHDHDLGGVQKVHTTAVPRVGGLAVVGGIVGGLWLFAHLWPDALSVWRLHRLQTLLAVSAPAFLAGMIEDVTKKVSVKLRLAATVLSSLLASYALGATVDQLNIWGVDWLLMLAPVAVVVTAVVVAGGANAINIIDGFNGLSTSTLMVIAGGLSFVAWQSNDLFVTRLGVLCIGATLGFFVFNYPYGKLFLGDGGAYFLGFWVAEMAVLLLVRDSHVNAWQVLAICAYPVIEVMFSIYRRKFIKKVSPGAPDALHLHTLVYRRLVFTLVPKDQNRPWQRNAAVACVIVPVVAVCVGLSALFATTTFAGLLFVLAQVLLYVAAYRRLVHGRWMVPTVFGIGADEAPAQNQP
jgi:UDP-N-acetylmuramyl pentapeptide phosphotransferase/UDP-N-acetylglucosamine-1-phosphate transferase